VVGLNFTQGDKAAYSELAEGRALIANGILAAQFGFKVGDTVRLSTPSGQQEYRVAAISGDFFNAKIMTAYTSQANLKSDWRKTEDIFIQLNLAPGADEAAVEPRLKAIADDYPQFKLVSGKAYYEQTKQLMDVGFSMYYVLFGVLALPSLIALLNTLAIGVIERTREIGMLRAIGATRPQVRRMVIAEALLLAAIGTAFGLLAGLYLSYVMVLGMSVVFPIAYSLPFSGIIAATAIGLIFGVIAALVPARQAAGMEIVRALRYE
jgi:putative ABC transport system permease protein